MRKSIQYSVLVFTVLAIVVSVYWRTVSFTFVSDDLRILRLIQANNTVTVLQTFFDYKDRLFYRPLGLTYMLLIYDLFGSHPTVFHVASLLIHTINACLVWLILFRLLRDRLISYCVAFIYAAAVSIHVDLFAWATAGIYDLGGSFFFLLSFWLFLGVEQDRVKGNTAPSSHTKLRLAGSCLAYFVGSLFKEAVIVLPAILFSYPWIWQPRSEWKRILIFYRLRIRKYCAFFAYQIKTGRELPRLFCGQPF